MISEAVVVTPIAALVIGVLTFAQLDPASGWASFGIAGLVLSWLLMIHLPAKDKQLKEFLDAGADERAKNREHIEQLVKAFAAEQAAERKLCQEELRAVNLGLKVIQTTLAVGQDVLRESVKQIEAHHTWAVSAVSDTLEKLGEASKRGDHA